MGYPGMVAELDMLERLRVVHPIESLKPITDPRIVARTRDHTHLLLGASPRASLMLFRCCQGYAAVLGRGYVIPDDVKALVFPVLEHRLILNPESRLRKVTVSSVLKEILNEVPVPSTGVHQWKTA